MKYHIMTMALVLLSFVMTIGGCATPSAEIDDPSAFSKMEVGGIKSGMSRDDVFAILGEPESRVVTLDGESLFFKDINLSSVWVFLDRKGKVKDWEWSK